MPAPPALAATPYEEGKVLQLGVTQNGTIMACSVNPNCVSTASTNQLYAPAWRSNFASSQDAAKALESAIFDLYPDAELAKSLTYDFGQYRAFTVPSSFGKDVMEFLIKDEGVTNRNWEGDAPGAFVTYRSMAGSMKYIWPIQQPVSDFGAQRTRMEQVRQRLGWAVIGCELLECYSY